MHPPTSPKVECAVIMGCQDESIQEEAHAVYGGG